LLLVGFFKGLLCLSLYNSSLYAKTDDSIAPYWDVLIGGNRIAVKTLDLNVPFVEIAEQLDGIMGMFFESYLSEVRAG
jgi:hypothetical protein